MGIQKRESSRRPAPPSKHPQNKTYDEHKAEQITSCQS